MTRLPLKKANNDVGVIISATFDINGDKVPITSQDLSNLQEGIKFSLSQPVTLGTANQFLSWLDDNLSPPFPANGLRGVIESIPTTPTPLNNIRQGLLDFLDADITITKLSVDTGSHEYSFGVSATPQSPIQIISQLSLDSIGVEISSTGEEPPEDGGDNG
ncbi:hypothetical protein [Microbulbifer epialgicus]|uniref:Uncharacterized protein n=1 Tax=Microbulbifer epialgicus TaxID=393907 RepID=A0ABV4P0P8_9GAMM